MTLDIFARVCSLHVFSKSGSTINTKFQTFPNICGILLYCEHNYLIKHAYPFYSFKLRHPRHISERGRSFLIFLSRHFDFLNRVCLYSVYGKTFGLVVETLAELHSCVLEISAFFAKVYIYFGNKGTCHFDVSS